LERRTVEIADAWNDPEYLEKQEARVGNVRAMLGVPLMRDGEPIGAFALARSEPIPFTQRQVELVTTFADQAVIAIENVRLFEEVQARTRDLTEALQQQTATADVLKVISRSAFDLQKVLDTLAASAVSLCGARGGIIFLKSGDRFELKAVTDESLEPALFRWLRETPLRPGRGTAGARVLLTGEVQNIPDVLTDPEFEPAPRELIVNRALLGVPLKRGEDLVGAFVLARADPGAFTERHIQIVQTFADQAVIAIENVRLFDEVQARTRDLTEALQQQTATADVLKVISRSAFDLQTVLDTLVASAAALIGANFAVMNLRRDSGIRAEATFGCPPELVQFLAEHPQKAGRETAAGRVFLSGEVHNIPDALADPEYEYGNAPQLGNFRALLGVPLFRDGKVEGSFTLGRAQPGPFTRRQIEIVQSFADQAVIAIENVRLFDEVQARTRDLAESLQQQTATSEVLKVITRSAFDLQAVLDTLVRSAMELSNASTGVVYLQESDAFHVKAHAGLSEDLVRYLRQNPQRPGRGSGGGRVLLTGKVQNIPDVLADDEYDPALKSTSKARALLGVPLTRNQAIVGAIMLTRTQVGVFTDRQIEIVQTFADQAVIAIENARLFNEVQSRTHELAQSLDDLRKAQDRLIQSEKLASLGQLTAGIAHEIKNPLNFVNNFSALSRELLDELREALEKAPLEKAMADETQDLIGMVASNLDKVVSHGKRADSIVKNMLLHSREGFGERAPVNINAMVEEALNLAYHGARAERSGFNVTIVKSLDPRAGSAEVYAQEMTRVLLNLISNGFYATTKRKQAQSNGTYEPTITASTHDLGYSVEIAIRDNGTGIPDEVKAKMFNPFFTTKPAGEGTGLGLSLSHDIVVKQHGGSIDVSTEPGAFTQFTIRLPRTTPEAPAMTGDAA
jgi:two-component system NtrC family sensor kinase